MTSSWRYCSRVTCSSRRSCSLNWTACGTRNAPACTTTWLGPSRISGSLLRIIRAHSYTSTLLCIRMYCTLSNVHCTLHVHVHRFRRPTFQHFCTVDTWLATSGRVSRPAVPTRECSSQAAAALRVCKNFLYMRTSASVYSINLDTCIANCAYVPLHVWTALKLFPIVVTSFICFVRASLWSARAIQL